LKIRRDFYFGNQNEEWLGRLRLAKKAIHDSLNKESSNQFYQMVNTSGSKQSK